MAYLKTASPLKVGDDYIYPITTSSQVVMDDNKTRLNQIVSNPNLLINPFFTVNQRNFSGLNSGTDSYCYDCWKMSNGCSITKALVGVNVTIPSTGKGLYHPIEKALFHDGEEVTLSIWVGNEIYHKTFNLNFDGIWHDAYIYADNTLYAGYRIVGDVIDLRPVLSNISTSQTVDVHAVKLERGSVSTLANDHEPDYSEELLKCNRYLFPMETYTASRYRVIGYSANTLEFFIPIPTQMRTSPSILNIENISIFTLLGTGITNGFTFSIIAYKTGLYVTASKNGHGYTDGVLTGGTTKPPMFSAEL